MPESGVPADGRAKLPERFVRQRPLRLPEISEPEIIRHFTKLSSLNYHVECGMYPLGSCTMKYNPKVNEQIARMPGFAAVHPLSPERSVQGSLEVLYELSGYLAELSGMADVSLLPVAGAHSELVSLLMLRKYFDKKGERRKTILVPDSAHGTNPASSVVAGFEPVKLRSDEKGLIDLCHLGELMNDGVASLMLTVPNTLGLFESQIEEVVKMAHEKGCIVYLDGANLNAFLGILKPGEIGIDMMHFNLHKTFGSPHGTGGPGGGGVGVTSELAPYLPVPRVQQGESGFTLSYDSPDSVGPVHGFYGNFGVSVRAYAYVNALGAEGLSEVAENSIVNANYLMSELKEFYDLPYPGPCMHEFVISGDRQAKLGVRTLDIAKRLLDYGFHPPTVYFPLIVHEALMIEPTETEGLETLNEFRDALIKIAGEAEKEPDVVRSAPHRTPVGRLDEATAARNLDVNFFAV